MSEPLFSIITAAYNASDTIGEAIGSAQRQTLGDFELIVIDDGSRDATAALVERIAGGDPRIRLHRQANAGANATRNRAIAAARGRYVTFLDSDDLKMPDYLEGAAAALEADPLAGLAFSDSYILDDDTRRIHRSTFMGALGDYEDLPLDPEAFLTRLLEKCFIPFTATTLRRSVLEEIGAFDPRLAGTDDYELWMRVVAAGHRAVRIPGVRSIMRRRAGQISGDLPVMWSNLRDTYLVVADEFEVSDAIRAGARSRAEALEPVIAAARETAALRRARGPLARLAAGVWSWRTAVTWPRSWHPRLPADVARAFPDLRRRTPPTHDDALSAPSPATVGGE